MGALWSIAAYTVRYPRKDSTSENLRVFDPQFTTGSLSPNNVLQPFYATPNYKISAGVLLGDPRIRVGLTACGIRCFVSHTPCPHSQILTMMHIDNRLEDRRMHLVYISPNLQRVPQSVPSRNLHPIGECPSIPHSTPCNNPTNSVTSMTMGNFYPYPRANRRYRPCVLGLFTLLPSNPAIHAMLTLRVGNV